MFCTQGLVIHQNAVDITFNCFGKLLLYMFLRKEILMKKFQKMIIIKFKLFAEINKSKNNWIKAQLYLIEW